MTHEKYCRHLLYYTNRLALFKGYQVPPFVTPSFMFYKSHSVLLLYFDHMAC